MIQDFIQALAQVSSLPSFWTAMACSCIMASFFGATIYDGEVPHAKKGIASVLSYIFMMILVMGSYVIERYPNIRPDVAYQLFIYPVQLLYLSIFWAFGFITTIMLFRWKCKRRKV